MPVQADCSFWLGLSIIITLSTLFIHITSAQEKFIVPSNAQCACRGDVLVYTCTAVGAGSTKWNGTAFSCENNEITLRHSLYDDLGGTSGECNDGAIVGRSVGFDGIRYTSQLTVTINERVSSNTTVMCVFNIERVIGSSVLEVVSAAYPPPSDVRLVNAYTDNITFNWKSVSLSNCSASLHYIITSNGCGECPSVTNSTNVTCSNLTVPSMCSLSVKSVVCGFEGVASGPFAVTLKLPEAKPTIAVIPHYLNSTGGLVNLSVQVAINETLRNEADGVLRVTGYNVSYISSTSGDIFDSNFIPIPGANSTTNELVVSAPTASVCQNSYINVSVSTVNQLGQGPSSDHITIGCQLSDTFVEVFYTQESNTISCSFQDWQDDAENSCSVMYGQCGTSLNYGVPENRTTDSLGTIHLKLQTLFVNQTFCYAVRATSATGRIIIIEGTVSGDISGRPDIGSKDITIIIAAAVVPTSVLLLLIGITVVVLLILLFAMHKRKIIPDPSGKANLHHERPQKENTVLGRFMP